MKGALVWWTFPSGKQTKVKIYLLVGVYEFDVHSRIEKPRVVISVCEYDVGDYFLCLKIFIYDGCYACWWWILRWVIKSKMISF